MARTTRLNGTPTIETSAPTRRVKSDEQKQAAAERKAAREAAVQAAIQAEQQAAIEAAVKAAITTLPMHRRLVTSIRQSTLRQRIEVVAITLLVLSLSHCQTAIIALTGMANWHALLLAIGIDAGLVLSEMAELRSRNKNGHWWTYLTLGWCAMLTVMLNTHGVWGHHQAVANYQWAFQLALGVSVPGLIFCLFRVAAVMSDE